MFPKNIELNKKKYSFNTFSFVKLHLRMIVIVCFMANANTNQPGKSDHRIKELRN